MKALAGIDRLLAAAPDASPVLRPADRAEAARLAQRILPRLAALVLAACADGGDGTGDKPVDTEETAEDTAPPDSAPPDTVDPDADEDGDGYPAREDCNDRNAAIHPGVPDPCDGVDDDCDGVVDDGGDGAALCAEDAAEWFVQEQEYWHGDGCGASISGDVNGDGRSDLLLGGAVGGGGRVHVFVSGDFAPGTVATALDRWLLVGAPGDYASDCAYYSGRGATFVPDLDGDGRDEVLVGASGADGDKGGAYLVMADALSAVEGERSLPDVAHVLLLDPDGEPEDYNGISVGALGDVDGDGLSELLAGARQGAWLVHSGAIQAEAPVLSDGVRFTAPDSAGDFDFAQSPVSAGDLDGDGLADVLLTCPTCDGNWPVYLFLGASLPRSGEVLAIQADLVVNGEPDHSFSSEISGGADVDRDGLDDWCVGSTSPGSRGGVYLFLNTPALLGAEATATSAQVRITDDNDEHGYFGVSVSLGDFDGDGAPDLAVEDNYPELWYYVFHHSSFALGGFVDVSTAGHRFVPLEQLPMVGGRLDMTGDANGDGRLDLLASDFGWGPYGYPDGYGAAFLFLGR